MSSPGQRRGSCGHAMAGFDTHSKCARCRDKGLADDPCVQKKECLICKGFTPDQVLQLATPAYRDRKEKKATSTTSANSTPTLVDPAHVSVLARVEKVKDVSSTPTTKKTKRSESPSASKKRSSSKPSAEDLKNLDDKWAERFSRLEAMILAKTFTVPVEPVVKPPSDVTPTGKPFFEPSTSKLPVEKTLTSEKPGPCLVQATGNAAEEMQTATQPLGAPGAGIATQPVQAPGSFPEVQPTGDEDMSAASDSEADQFSTTGSLGPDTHRDRSADRDGPKDDPATEPTEEANYRETMRGVRSFMNWHRVPEFETVSSTSDDNPFAGARTQPTGKVSVKLPVDDWLCRKMTSLNLPIKEGYPTRNTDSTGLLRDQFIKTPRPSRWYGMHAEKDESSTVCTWSPDPAKLNHSFSRVARRNLPSAPPSRLFSQELLGRWERAAREQTVMCNQAAGLSRCLTRVQDSMNIQLKTLSQNSKGKSSEKMGQAINELEYLTTFNRSISQAMARTMQDLSEAVFINMANFTLARRDSYLDYLHAGVKHDTINALRTSPVHLDALFPDQLLAKAEEEISKSEERRSSGTSHRQQGRFHPYSASDKSASRHTDRKNVPAWKQIRDNQQSRRGRGKASNYSQKPAKGSKPSK